MSPQREKVNNIITEVRLKDGMIMKGYSDPVEILETPLLLDRTVNMFRDTFAQPPWDEAYVDSLGKKVTLADIAARLNSPGAGAQTLSELESLPGFQSMVEGADWSPFFDVISTGEKFTRYFESGGPAVLLYDHNGNVVGMILSEIATQSSIIANISSDVGGLRAARGTGSTLSSISESSTHSVYFAELAVMKEFRGAKGYSVLNMFYLFSQLLSEKTLADPRLDLDSLIINWTNVKSKAALLIASAGFVPFASDGSGSNVASALTIEDYQSVFSGWGKADGSVNVAGMLTKFFPTIRRSRKRFKNV